MAEDGQTIELTCDKSTVSEDNEWTRQSLSDHPGTIIIDTQDGSGHHRICKNNSGRWVISIRQDGFLHKINDIRQSLARKNFFEPFLASRLLCYTSAIKADTNRLFSSCRQWSNNLSLKLTAIHLFVLLLINTSNWGFVIFQLHERNLTQMFGRFTFKNNSVGYMWQIFAVAIYILKPSLDPRPFFSIMAAKNVTPN